MQRKLDGSRLKKKRICKSAPQPWQVRAATLISGQFSIFSQVSVVALDLSVAVLRPELVKYVDFLS